jgi:glutamyl-tRNA synthetase
VFPLQWQDPVTKEISSGYREKGYYADGFINMLALLGWHSSGNQELFTLDELVNEFSLERVSKSGAKFDPEKTKWFNQQYLRKRSDEELAKAWLTELESKGIKTDLSFATKVVSLIKEKAVFANDLWALGSFFFQQPAEYDKDVVKKRWNENSAKFLMELKSEFGNLSSFTAAETESTFKTTAEKLGINPGHVMQLFRVCVSGLGGGPVLFDMVALLGKEEIVNRLGIAVEKLEVRSEK